MSWRDYMGQKNIHQDNVRCHRNAVLSRSQVRIGMRIWWTSPLFGEATGIVCMTPESGHVVIQDHNVTGQTCPIPYDWIIRLEHGIDGSIEDVRDIEDGSAQPYQ